jgi:hypothetical protein
MTQPQRQAWQGLIAVTEVLESGWCLVGGQMINGGPKIDVLIPRHVGERAARRRGASSGTTLETSGAQQALDRAELIEVSVEGRDGRIPRPNMAGAPVIKAAAYANTRDRHLTDFVTLTTLVNRSDRLGETFTKRDKAYLRPVLAECARRPELLAQVEGIDRGLYVLARIVVDGSSQ